MLAACLVLLIGGCEDDDYNHVPAPGQGTLIVDNDHAEDISLYIDGERIREIKDGHESFNDIAPGLYRVVLIDDDGVAYRDDVDIIEGRLTILEVLGGYDELNVNLRLD
jgi:hypothetical protein